MLKDNKKAVKQYAQLIKSIDQETKWLQGYENGVLIAHFEQIYHALLIPLISNIIWLLEIYSLILTEFG